LNGIFIVHTVSVPACPDTKASILPGLYGAQIVIKNIKWKQGGDRMGGKTIAIMAMLMLVMFALIASNIITNRNNIKTQIQERDNIIEALSERWTRCADEEKQGFISITIASHKLAFEDVSGKKAEIFIGPHKIIYKGDLEPNESAQMFFEAFGKYVNK
jgi:hypothetical protein